MFWQKKEIFIQKMWQHTGGGGGGWVLEELDGLVIKLENNIWGEV